MKKKLKIIAISSPGGHWIQLQKICNPLEEIFNIVYVNPNNQFTKSDDDSSKNISIIDASAKTKLKLIVLSFQLTKILIFERPKYIISTGAAPGAIAVLLAKLLPCKTIWIDSIANTKELSFSGKLVKNHVTIFLTQWENLVDNKIMFKGALL
jgi:UDP-N-acetylglucosamine:LPS N-acetylglucosamine transferase